MELRCLQQEDFPRLHTAYLRAFSDYIVKNQPSESQLSELLTRRGIDYSLSVAAFDNEQIVGFNLNGLDNWNDKLTVYDISTGVLPEYRGRRISSELFQYSLPLLKARQVEQYLLEVIETNLSAFKVYSGIGFQINRKFDCYKFIPEQANQANQANQAKVDRQELADVQFKIVDQLDWQLVETFWQWQSSWQNSINSIKRSLDKKIFLAAYRDNRCLGYGIVFPATGDIPQFAVDKSERIKGIGAAIIQRLIGNVDAGLPARVLNVDSSAYDLKDFLDKLGFEHFISQNEMIMTL